MQLVPRLQCGRSGPRSEPCCEWPAARVGCDVADVLKQTDLGYVADRVVGVLKQLLDGSEHSLELRRLPTVQQHHKVPGKFPRLDVNAPAVCSREVRVQLVPRYRERRACSPQGGHDLAVRVVRGSRLMAGRISIEPLGGKPARDLLFEGEVPLTGPVGTEPGDDRVED